MFELDSRLKNDTFDFGSFPLCRVLLLNDCSYPWFILVPQREALQEIYQLSEADRQLFWDESNQLSLWMKHYFNFDKLNIAALGNVVNQLHLHHVGRTIGTQLGQILCGDIVRQFLIVIKMLNVYIERSK